WQTLESLFRYRSGLTIYPSQARDIEKALDNLFEKTVAQSLLLADTSGELIATRGEINNHHRAVLSSLVASDLAASREISHLTGEYDDFQLILREGKDSHIFIAGAGPTLVLFAQIASKTPLGWARLALKQTAQRLHQIVLSDPDEKNNPVVSLSREEIANQIGVSLDSIWKE
ncbi:MAG: roadblock/LC7 domain-containing protein, partial [Chloroflexota bacterium]